MILGLLMWACDAPPEDSTPPEDSAAVSSELIPLEAPRLLRRLSLDLRGVLPSPDEQEALEADPEQLNQLLEQMLEDPRLEDQIVEWLTERWHTRIDAFIVLMGLPCCALFGFNGCVCVADYKGGLPLC